MGFSGLADGHMDRQLWSERLDVQPAGEHCTYRPSLGQGTCIRPLEDATGAKSSGDTAVHRRLVALVPVTLMPSKPAAVLYLAVFGAGTILGMAAYAALAATAVGRVAASARLARAAAFATAGASGVVGLWWIATGVIALRA